MYNLNQISAMVVGSSSTNSSSSTNNSSSSLSFPSPNWIHHVFPSFHGPDVRKGFLSHILESFKRNGIDPFIDNNIERSKSIGPELKDAIRGSRIGIVLLSKNYASSSWCLDELVEIMNCRKVLGQIVITIFYDVPPTHIRKQIGGFGEAFKKTCKEKPKEHTERWRKALEDVAGIAGMESGVWDNEAVMIEKLTDEVLSKLKNFTPPRDFKDLVGMNTHMEEIKRLISPNVNEGRMIGIWGPVGIGKTTIARFLFHQLSSRFQLRAIMVNIKANYPQRHLDDYGALEKLQHQMLLKISNQKDNQKEVPNLELALNVLRDKKVLLVLDDVDRIEQVHALAKEIGWFGPGSFIIITTENRRILEKQGIKHIYKVKSPSSEEAFKIFCMNAFGKEYPDDGFYDLACEATDLAGELPLGLKVLGSALRGMSKQEWRRALPVLKARLVDRDIESIINFSYDALHDEEKDLFLYIACLFRSYIKAHQVEELLAKKFWNVKQSVDILIKKSFIYIENGSFKVHTLLEQFGRKILRKQVECQLLINAKDLCDHRIDCSKVIGINLNFEEELYELNISEKAVERMYDVQFVIIFDRIPDGCASSERLHSLLYHSQMLRYLRWNNFQNKSLPATFNPEYLVELHMIFSKLQKLWEENKPLNCLKSINLSHSEYLKELPDLSAAINLRRLTISGCQSLRKLRKFHLPNNIASPQLSDSLTCIDASNCGSLERLECSFNNPDICLIFFNCFKLNQKGRDLIMHTPTSKYAVLPGKHVPTCFNYRATDGGSLTIKLNETSFSTSLKFQACIILERIECDYPAYPSINIMVRNKEETRDYLSGYEDITIMVKNNRRYIPHPQTEHIYTFEVEVSEVTSTELVFEFKTDLSNWKVGECGLLQIFDAPIKERICPQTYNSYNVGIIFSLLSTLYKKYQRRKKEKKNRSNHSYFYERLMSEDRDERKRRRQNVSHA